MKPSGTTSCVLGTSSGVHAWHNDYYIRRMRVGKNEAIYTYLTIRHPELVEDDFLSLKLKLLFLFLNALQTMVFCDTKLL